MRKARVLAALCAAVLMCGFATPAYAGGGEAYGDGTGGVELWDGLDPAEPTPEPNPLTPDGQGTVLDNATDDEGKEFFTITTADEAVFYLVIDRQKSAENVYFLNAVTVADLMALAENTEGAAPVTPAPEPEPDPAPSPEPEPAPKQGGGPLGTVLLVVAVVVLGGGAGWYLKIYRPKHQAPDLDEQDMLDYEPEGPGDGEAEADEEDGPPWEDSDGEEDEE